MGMIFRFAAPATGGVASDIRLSGRVRGQLSPAEQLVVWALREASGAHDDAAERLSCGFRLAFGPRLTGAAACAFDGLCRCLASDAARSPRICPLHCACLSVDEQTLLYGLAAAQIGDRALHAALLDRFVPNSAKAQLWQRCRLFSWAMRHVSLTLPDCRLVELPSSAACH